MPDGDLPRVPGSDGPRSYDALADHYGSLPAGVAREPAAVLRSMTRDLLAGAVNWRCPELQYNLGAAVNVAAAAMYAAALDVNVYLINDGLAGNAVVAERAVGRILSQLAGVPTDHGHGLFTFGGTGTMAYAIKAGLRKVAPDSAQRGAPAAVAVVVTEDAHFSHATAADWLGVGSDHLITLPADHERRTDLPGAETLLRDALDRGIRIATIIINGGTTYDHAIDDITAFAALRDRLVEEYELPYRPHLHVDSVVGWVWLILRGHDFERDDLDVPGEVVDVLLRQRDRISPIRLADSWGVDFHKGLGACPVDCSFVQFNDRADLARLRKGGPSGTALHQLAEEFSDVSPVDFTLETSRSAGKALAALASLHTLGRTGYQTILARLMTATLAFRREVAAEPGLTVLNPHALGYQTMVRLLPPSATYLTAADELYRSSADDAQRVRDGNTYLKSFFAWDNDTRMIHNGGGAVYSFSSTYITTASGAPISGLKFYPTNPQITVRHMEEAVRLLADRKIQFDRLAQRDQT
ncbi:MAG: hypothetical protein ACRDT0_00045 [Pseudonocardiaceae bacterium]